MEACPAEPVREERGRPQLLSAQIRKAEAAAEPLTGTSGGAGPGAFVFQQVLMAGAKAIIKTSEERKRTDVTTTEEGS